MERNAALNTTGLTPYTDTGTALALRDSVSRRPFSSPAPESTVQVDADSSTPVRQNVIKPYDDSVALQNRKPLYPQADTNSRTRQALNAYGQVEQVEKQDELSQLFGVDVYI